ncbi:anti-repressor SinI family protein [Neobacillus cucumis]|nr:anti-repressor SinI family protein [Neobacillus cucumis]MBI0577465.1 anti-repressor SinI family protein [Neobacillus cucumis]
MVIHQIGENELDKEWLNLIIQARNLGITIAEIKKFLKIP